MWGFEPPSTAPLFCGLELGFIRSKLRATNHEVLVRVFTWVPQ